MLLDPATSGVTRHYLTYKPSADMFASSTHHHLPRYYSKDGSNMASAGVDAFQYDLQSEPSTYFNPPWTLIHAVLRKLQDEKVRGMMVVPEWPSAARWLSLSPSASKRGVFQRPSFCPTMGPCVLALHGTLSLVSWMVGGVVIRLSFTGDAHAWSRGEAPGCPRTPPLANGATAQRRAP